MQPCILSYESFSLSLSDGLLIFLHCSFYASKQAAYNFLIYAHSCNKSIVQAQETLDIYDITVFTFVFLLVAYSYVAGMLIL